MKRIMATAVASVVLAAGLVGIGSAGATPGGEEPCVPREAYTEVIHHPALTHIHKVLVKPEVPAVAEVWANFSPNDHKGPFDGPPSYPNDERGTWHVKDKIPGGHEGLDGVYQQGNGHGSWFYRAAGSEYQPPVFRDELRVDKPAWDETINHPEVTCDNVIAYPNEPTITDPCGEGNAVWVVPAIAGPITWEVSEANGHLIASINVEGKTFENGETSKDFGAPVETNVDECKVDTPPVKDNCDRPVIGGKCAPVENEPKPEVGTSCTATKCVRTNEDGSVDVTDYGNDVVEEGF